MRGMRNTCKLLLLSPHPSLSYISRNKRTSQEITSVRPTSPPPENETELTTNRRDLLSNAPLSARELWLDEQIALPELAHGTKGRMVFSWRGQGRLTMMMALCGSMARAMEFCWTEGAFEEMNQQVNTEMIPLAIDAF